MDRKCQARLPALAAGWALPSPKAHEAAAPGRRRLGSSANSCIKLKPNYPNHVWSYDFLFDATEDGRRLK